MKIFSAKIYMEIFSSNKIYIYVIGYGKTAHFAHYFKIELLVFKGSVDLKQ